MDTNATETKSIGTDSIGTDLIKTASLLRACAASVLIACAAAAPATTARAQTAEPQLGCYVDTPAWDVPTEGGCEGVAPSSWSVVFEVMYRQTPYSRYSYVWTGCSNPSGHFCLVQGGGGAGGRVQTATVLITDHQTGLTYTRTATATVYRNW